MPSADAATLPPGHPPTAEEGASGVSGTIAGQTETATLFILRAIDEGKDPQGYIVALTLALASILLLGGIELFKHRQERKRTR